MITITGVASGVVFFGEVLGIEKLIGAAVILVGVYMARRVVDAGPCTRVFQRSQLLVEARPLVADLDTVIQATPA
jgi:type IV secretory pathway TrbD component